MEDGTCPSRAPAFLREAERGAVFLRRKARANE